MLTPSRSTGFVLLTLLASCGTARPRPPYPIDVVVQEVSQRYDKPSGTLWLNANARLQQLAPDRWEIHVEVEGVNRSTDDSVRPRARAVVLDGAKELRTLEVGLGIRTEVEPAEQRGGSNAEGASSGEAFDGDY